MKCRRQLKEKGRLIQKEQNSPGDQSNFFSSKLFEFSLDCTLDTGLLTSRPDAPLTSRPLEGYSGGTPAFRTRDCRSSSPLLTLKNALITRLTSCLVPHKLSSQGISTNPALLLNKYKQKGSCDAAQILPENDFLSFHCHLLFFIK